MTEAEWLACTDPARMLDWFWRKALDSQRSRKEEGCSDRKLRLFACACIDLRAKQRPEFLGVSRMNWELAEQGAFAGQGSDPYEWANNWVRGPETDWPPPSDKAALLRDIFGNPFRPVKFAEDTLSGHPDGTYQQPGQDLPRLLSPAILRWNDGTVPKIAQRIYDDRSFDDMPILADALEDAGCENEEILAHCRGMERCPKCLGVPEPDTIIPVANKRVSTLCLRCMEGRGWAPLCGPHVRGCWVLDLLLGKE